MDKEYAGYILDGNSDVKISENVVKSIVDDVNVERDDVIDILKTIEVKRETYGDVDKSYEAIEDYDLSRGLKILLENFIPSVLISTLEDMKYYQIQTVLEATNPCAVIVNL